MLLDLELLINHTRYIDDDDNDTYDDDKYDDNGKPLIKCNADCKLSLWWSR